MKVWFIVVPLLVLLAFTFISTATAALAIGQSFTGTYCNPNGGASCTNGMQQIVYTCPAGGSGGTPPQPCNITPINSDGSMGYCPSNPPSPSYCTAGGLWLLPAGNTVTVSDSTAAAIWGSNGNPSGIQISTGSIGVSGFISIIGGIMALAILASVVVFGSGLNTEAVHITFVIGGLLALWGVLSLAEGYVTGNPNSGFAHIDGLLPGAGLGIYVIATLFYTIGSISAVSRGT